MVYDPRPRVSMTVEQSPWQTFFESIPDTILAFHQLNQQLGARQEEFQWRSAEAALDREFKVQQNELSIAAGQYNVLQERLFNLEDQMIGYELPYSKTTTSDGADLITGTVGDLKTGIGQKSEQIGQIQQALSEIEAAKDYAGGLADEYGSLIKAGKDELWRDYLLEGDITMGEGGELVGTGEMAVYLETLRTGTPGQKEQYEKLKDANYRRAMLSSLRTIEEAKNLEAIDVQLDAAKLNMESTRLTISKNEFEYSVAQLDQLDEQVGDIYINTALSAKANFRYISDGVAYSITDLFSKAAIDIDAFIDIKQDFLNDPLNYAIAHEAEAFISGIQQAAASGMEDSEFVVRFQKAAYDNYIQLQNLTETLMSNVSRENRSLKEFLEALPDSDNTKATYKRLNDKHTGYKRLGLFRSGPEMLDRTAQVVNMHNEAQAIRLGLDASTAGHIAEHGLGLREPEDYSPTGDMTPKMQQDLEVALATLASYTPSADPAVVGTSAVFDQKISADSTQLSQVNASLDALQAIGMGRSPDAIALRNEISDLTQQISSDKMTKAFAAQSAEMFPGTYYTSLGGRIITEEEIQQAADATGKTVEEIKMAIKQEQEDLQKRRPAGYMDPDRSSMYGRRVK